MLLSIARDIIQALPPLEVAITLGVILFALSWVRPMRIVSLPESGRRTAVLTGAGIAGSLVVIVVATVVSVIAYSTYDLSGFAGWWRRPAPLVAATLVVVVAALLLRRMPLPAPRERAIVPRRRWHAFAPRATLWVAGVTAALLALTALWQTVIATAAPKDGPFFGITAEHTDLPIYMTFNNGYGYVAGAGWPNNLATLIALAIAALVFIWALSVDANRPIYARSSASSVRIERELTARLFTFILFGGLLTTLGAVWMHAGSIGQGMVGIDSEWTSDGQSIARILIGSGYDAIARPMNLIGHLLQGAGVAFLLRVATDTARAALGLRRTRAETPAPVASVAGTRS